MSPQFRKVALIAASLGLLLSLFLALRPQDEEATSPPPATTDVPPGPQIVDIEATSGEIVRVTVERGRQVVLNISAGVADHVHLHGYDLMAEVAPGRVARLAFRADTPGRFELELEERDLQIGVVEVGS